MLIGAALAVAILMLAGDGPAAVPWLSGPSAAAVTVPDPKFADHPGLPLVEGTKAQAEYLVALARHKVTKKKAEALLVERDDIFQRIEQWNSQFE